jgi:ligand-binding sensor domain-containing protein
MLGIVLAICPSASALNPSLDISQYGHTAGITRDGFVGGVEAFAQTSDGYLWVGGIGGLFRFDRIRAVRWALPAAQKGYLSEEVIDLWLRVTGRCGSAVDRSS